MYVRMCTCMCRCMCRCMCVVTRDNYSVMSLALRPGSVSMVSLGTTKKDVVCRDRAAADNSIGPQTRACIILYEINCMQCIIYLNAQTYPADGTCACRLLQVVFLAPCPNARQAEDVVAQRKDPARHAPLFGCWTVHYTRTKNMNYEPETAANQVGNLKAKCTMMLGSPSIRRYCRCSWCCCCGSW